MSNTQAELSDMPDLSDTHILVDIPEFGQVWAVNDIYGYYSTWLDWHNKRMSELLDRLETHYWLNDDIDTLMCPEIEAFVEAERNHLNQSNSTPFNKLKEPNNDI